MLFEMLCKVVTPVIQREHYVIDTSRDVITTSRDVITTSRDVITTSRDVITKPTCPGVPDGVSSSVSVSVQREYHFLSPLLFLFLAARPRGWKRNLKNFY